MNSYRHSHIEVPKSEKIMGLNPGSRSNEFRRKRLDLLEENSKVIDMKMKFIRKAHADEILRMAENT